MRITLVALAMTLLGCGQISNPMPGVRASADELATRVRARDLDVSLRLDERDGLSALRLTLDQPPRRRARFAVLAGGTRVADVVFEAGETDRTIELAIDGPDGAAALTVEPAATTDEAPGASDSGYDPTGGTWGTPHPRPVPDPHGPATR